MPYVFSLHRTNGKRLWRCCLNTRGRAPNCGGCEQCKAYKISDRRRCQNKTCFGNYCHLHLRRPFYERANSINPVEIGVKIDTSSIPNAGRGLFTTKAFAKNVPIMRLDYQRLTQQETDARYDYDNVVGTAPYGISLNAHVKNTVADAACIRNAPSFANDSRDNRINARFQYHNKKVWLRTTKAIPANKEIFIRYGAQYWQGAHATPHTLKMVPRVKNPVKQRGVIVRDPQ